MKANELRQHVTPDPRPGCGHLFEYRGIRVSQSPLVLDALDTLHDNTFNHSPDTIIEIGTMYGGFTQLLRDHDISNNCNVHTFDIRDYAGPLRGNIIRHFGDVFGDQRQAVTDLIQRSGRCFVFCDGGNKEHEVNTFCEFLKPGDLILCHDYARDLSVVNTAANGFWPGYESLYVNIKDALARNDCVPFLDDEMQRAVWGCWCRIYVGPATA